MHDDEQPAELAARSPELQDLLRDLDGLRLALATDLSLAAAALEAGAPDLAGAVIDSDRAQLDAFAQRSLRRLAEAEQAPPAAVAEQAPVAVPRRRRSLLTAVTPLLATAAAVLGVLAGFVPTGGPEQAANAGSGSAMASYQEVTQLSRDGADAAQVASAAQRLHDELADIVSSAATDPTAAQEALALLESEARVLDGSPDRDALSGVIAEARALVARLRAALPATVRPPRVPAPPPPPGAVGVPAPASLAPPVAPAQPQPQPPPAQPSPQTAPSPQAAQSPSAAPSPQSPQAAPPPHASPAPAQEPEPVEQDAALPDAVHPG